MRQHVNPLSRFFQIQTPLKSPEELFENADRPIHLDIGCARGLFLIEMATIYPKWNFLGIDIRSVLIEKAEQQRKSLGLTNASFLFCNANVSLGNWLQELDLKQLRRVSIQFPDPWFKKKHKKRRVVNPSLLHLIASYTSIGCELFIQTDVLDVMNPIQELIEVSECFDLIHLNNHPGSTISKSPFLVRTEREILALENGCNIYRGLYVRNNKEVPSINC